eukprot:1428745-Prymnesium_polylepis.1
MHALSVECNVLRTQRELRRLRAGGGEGHVWQEMVAERERVPASRAAAQVVRAAVHTCAALRTCAGCA